MQKIINIDGRDVKFKASASFVYRYKQQFGKDLLTLVMPLIKSALEGLNAFFALQSNNNEDMEALLSEINISSAIEKIELVDLFNIIWIMAKTANKDIAEPADWYDEFDVFPVFDVARELMEIFLPSLFITEESKKKLRTMIPRKKKK
ncbi:MAG: hypothetical protein GX808_04020 [Syntrophomonadaceae bacterium]|jgi:hypothetical protein|nr:hypothetical protein [Syntrophomonadaceae bacterium]